MSKTVHNSEVSQVVERESNTPSSPYEDGERTEKSERSVHINSSVINREIRYKDRHYVEYLYTQLSGL